MSLVKSLTLARTKPTLLGRGSLRAGDCADQWWYADEAASAVYGVDGTNPRCPLESTDRNPVSSLFPFHSSLAQGSGHAEKEREFFLLFLFLPPAAALRPSRSGQQNLGGRLPLAARLRACTPGACCTKEPTMFHRINRLAKRMARYSRFKVVAPGSQEGRGGKAEATNPQCPLESRTWLSRIFTILVSRWRLVGSQDGCGENEDQSWKVPLE